MADVEDDRQARAELQHLDWLIVRFPEFFLLVRSWWCRPPLYSVAVAGWTVVLTAAVAPNLGQWLPRFPFADPVETLMAVLTLWWVGALVASVGALWVTEALFRAWWRLWGWRRIPTTREWVTTLEALSAVERGRAGPSRPG
jgi:hypothetical protein